MTEAEFWKCTPKKLNGLVQVYIEQQGPGDEEPDGEAPAKQGFIDDLIL